MNPDLDPAICNAAAGNCRCCQLWGALAFDEPHPCFPERTAVVFPLADARGGSASVGETESSSVATVPSAAAATPARSPLHPQAPFGFVSVDAPEFPVAERRMDDDFMEARRNTIHALSVDGIRHAKANVLLACRESIRSQEIGFNFWTGFFSDDLGEAVCIITMQPWVSPAYVGISADCAWRC